MIIFSLGMVHPGQKAHSVLRIIYNICANLKGLMNLLNFFMAFAGKLATHKDGVIEYMNAGFIIYPVEWVLLEMCM